MRVHAALLVFGILFLPSPDAMAQTPGGVLNPGFESWTNGVLQSWTTQQGYVQPSHSSYHGGYWSLYFTGQTYPAQVYQDVPVNTNSQYLISAWVQTFGGNTGVLSVSDSQNASTSMSVSTSTNGAWQYVSLVYTSNLSGRVRISLSQSSGLAVAYWDDVSIVSLLTVGNSGFEGGATQPWIASGGALPSVVTTTSHTGTSSLAIPAAQTAAGVYQDINVTAGMQYVASAWVQTSDGATAQLYLDDSVSGSTAVMATAPSSKGVWQCISLTFTADQTAKIRLHLWQSGSGTVYWDDVALAPALALNNGGFEAATAQFWIVSGAASPAASNSTAHSGAWSLSIPATTTASGVYQDVAVTNGVSYTISGWVLAPSGSAASLYVEDSQSGDASSANVPAADGVWQYVSTTFMADTTKVLRVHLWQSGSGTVYWDDISVHQAAITLSQPYTLDYTASPLWSDWARWQANGTAPTSYGSYSMMPFPGSGGSYISIVPISGESPNNNEVDTTLALKSGGGTYIQFLRADSNYVQAGSGSYVSVEITIPSGYQSPGAATLTVNQCAKNTVSQIGSQSITATDGMTVKSVIWGANLYVFLNNVFAGSFTVPTIAGNPGFGGYNIPSGSGFSAVKLGPHYINPPSAISAAAIASSIFPTQVSLKWPAAASPVGIYRYNIYRNGAYFSQTSQPEFADSTVQSGSSYTYTVFAGDTHGNWAQSSPNIQVTTPSAQSIDPRRVGVFTTGSYWGGGGEQIDTLSGNLNFTLPLLTAMGRTGFKVPVNLSYNSQNWRQDSGVNWQLGNDVGYGFGWQARIGSITPYYTAWWLGPDHYVFTDGTGAEYRLDQNTNGVWSSTQGIYVWFDANANKLYFRDGTFWLMACTSGGSEPDAGTLYPTVIEDVNGNQVLVNYGMAGGIATPSSNSSARISGIEDVRGTYTFTWNYDAPTPHLTQITNSMGTSEKFTFTYSNNVQLGPPFGSDPAWFGTTTSHLASMAPTGLTPYQFSYDPAGASELTQVQFPFGGYLRWTFATDPYVDNRSLRAVSGRFLAADAAGSNEWNYGIVRDSAVSSVIHSTMTLSDASGTGAKTWNFITPASAAAPWQVGLASQFIQSSAPNGSVLQSDTYIWSQTPISSNPYIGTRVSVSNPGAPNQQSAQTTQSLDQYGNTLQAAIYPYNDSTTALKIYNSTYLSSPAYVSNYIRDRLLTTTLTTGGVTKALVNKCYDGKAATGQTGCITNPSWGPNTPYGYQPPTREIDSNPPVAFANRGLVSQTITPAKTTSMTYYDYGGFASGSSSGGATMKASADSATNYAAPQTITTQSYGETLGYSPWLGVTQATGLNGEQLTTTYDSMGRPVSATSPWGAGWNYAYSTGGPMWQAKTGPDGFTRTTFDGVGHAIRVERGPNANTIQSIVDTVYAPCACSPLGKVQKVSQPHPPNAPPDQIAWTVYSYDGLGRTLSVVQPDGASTTTYAYSGNQTTVTDPASKWKQFTSDVEGNLVSVTEPDPANQPGGTSTTSYAYDWMKHLTTVTMPRGGTTQTRTFAYDDAGRLTSATNPENGTVSYTYNTDNTLQYKHDAKGQDTVYTYDGQKRVTMIQRYPNGKSSYEDGCERITYSYDANPYDSSGTFQYTKGRLAAVQYPVCNVPDSTNVSVTEMYSYHPAGGVTIKRLHIYKPWYDDTYGWQDASTDVEADYSYTGWGAMQGVTLPTRTANNGSTTCSDCGIHAVPVAYNYYFDAMARPVSMRDNDQTSANGSGATWIQNVQYDYAGRLTNWQHYNGTRQDYYGTSIDTYAAETLTYNANGQLTSMNWSYNSASAPNSWSAPAGVQYIYSANQNNGQITQSVETASGQTISYQYDALKRLISSAATPNNGKTPAAWNESFQYDGFGNLTAKVLNGTTSAIPADSVTNRLLNAIYDKNGNMTSGFGGTFDYDVANRMITSKETSGGTESYSYTPENKRILRVKSSGSTEWTLWGARGEKLGTFAINAVTYGNNYFSYYYTVVNPTFSFAGRMIWEGGSPVVSDRLGTNRANGATFYPYGEEITSTTNDRTKFGTYNRDGFTGLDYADQRYYASTYGRFTTADRYRASAGAKDPSSWNRYAYVGGDPVTFSDPSGRIKCQIDGVDVACDIPLPDCGGSLLEGCLDEPEPDPGPGPQEPPLPPAQSDWQPPICSISLGDRPVPSNNSPANHSYLVVTDSDWNDRQTGVLIEGGPTGNFAFSSLWGYDTQRPGSGLGAGTPNASDPSLPSNHQAGRTYAGADACGAVQFLLTQVNNYDTGKLATYSAVPLLPGTYNSNSFTYTLLSNLAQSAYSDVLGAFGSQLYGWVPGWGLLVPHL